MAVRDTIQRGVLLNGNAIDADTCEVGFDGSPKPSAGQLYIAVHLGSWSMAPMGDWDFHEQVEIQVTVTLRLGDVPLDRYGIAAWVKATSGLDAICRQIIVLLHHNQAVRAAANVYIGSGSAGFVTTTQLVSAQPPKMQRAQWFLGNEPPADDVQAAMSGVSQTLTFKAQRCQGIDGTQT
jgi:hypothetical protein